MKDIEIDVDIYAYEAYQAALYTFAIYLLLLS